MKPYSCLPYVIDRGISRFLSTKDFMSLRRTSKKHYSDEEAYLIFSRYMPIRMNGLKTRETIGLHYLLSWSLKLDCDIGRLNWVQQIVDWLSYPISIKIMFYFLHKNCNDFLNEIDLSQLRSSQRFVWLKLYHRRNLCCGKSRVFKRKLLENKYNESGRKRTNYKIQVYRNLQPCR